MAIEIVRFPINNGDFPYVNLAQRVYSVRYTLEVVCDWHLFASSKGCRNTGTFLTSAGTAAVGIEVGCECWDPQEVNPRRSQLCLGKNGWFHGCLSQIISNRNSNQKTYALVRTDIAIERGHLQLIFPFNMVIFHDYVSLPEGICLTLQSSAFLPDIDTHIPYTMYNIYSTLYIYTSKACVQQKQIWSLQLSGWRGNGP